MSTFKTKTNAAQISAKLLSTSALTAVLAFTMNPAYAQDATVPDVTVPEAPSIETPAAPEAPAAEAAWTGFTDESGSITVETPTTTFTNITQNTQLYVGTSANLDIPEGYHVNIDQASSNYLFVAKAAPDADPTFILGRLTADGRVIIIDRNGVFTGANSVIDVAGIIMTTGDVDLEGLTEDEIKKVKASNVTEGAIELNGTITVADAGLAAFVAPTVVNAGVINATMGKVALASGEAVTIDLAGDDLVEITVPGDIADALIENSGSINANGGVVQITAAQAKDVVDNIINVSGIVDVSSVSTQGGKIVLSGGDAGKVQVTGILDASGATGGDIEVTGQFVSAEEHAVLDASGINGGGTIHFGGDWQGQGDTPTSEFAYVGQDAILNARADEEGDGGEVVVWSDVATGFFGLITAQGGANSGNGGSVETSSHGYLEAFGTVDASASNGFGGLWLLDPRNLTVIDPGADSNVTPSGGDPNSILATGNDGAGGASTSFVSDNTIEASLNGGTSVTLRTGDQDDGQGDITVNGAIDMNASTADADDDIATLRLEAHDDIFINNTIIASNGNRLNVELIAGADEDGTPNPGSDNDITVGANIATGGGNFLAEADDDVVIAATVGTDRANAADGNVTLRSLGLDASIGLVQISGRVDADDGADGGNADGNVLIEAEDILLNTGATRIDIGGSGDVLPDGTLTIRRITDGTIGIGSGAAAGSKTNMHISQAEIDTISSFGNVVIGHDVAASAKETAINVNGADMDAFAQTTFNALRNSSGSNNIDFFGANSFNALIAKADDDITTEASSSINTTGNALSFTAGDDIILDNNIITEGGSATFVAADLFQVDEGDDVIDTNHTTDGNVSITANQIDLADDDSAGQVIDAGTANVSIERSTAGNIMLGAATGLGGMHLTQKEIGNIDAGSLTVGGGNTSSISVSGVNTTTGTITGLVSLLTGVNLTGSDDDVNFLGTNTFNALNVLSNDDINFVGGAIVNVLNGDANFEGDTNDGSVGDFNMFSSSFLNTNGHNVNVSALGVTLYAGSIIDTNGGNVTVNTSDQFGGGLVDLLGGTIDATGAAGGDILINNEGRFYSLQANSLKTNNDGTITLNQWDQNGGSLQNAINALDNAGTGQNTLYAYKGTGDGTYTENLNINQAQLKLTGIDDGIGGPDVTIAGTMTVNASNFHLDPVVVDALGGAYGVIATGAGFNGFSSVGNTYKNSTVAGILLNGSTGTATVQGNTFEGNATRGVEISGLTGGLALINGNNMGVVNGNVVNGVWASGAITGGGVGIGGNTIVATGAGALFGGAVSNASVVITASNNITGIDGIEFSNNVTNSIVNISGGNTIIGTGNASFSDAIDFRGLVTGSTVNINNNTLLRGADDGIQVIGGIRGGTFTVSGNTQITGLNGDGIALLSLAGGGGNGNAISNGAEVEILNNTITGNGPEGDTDNGDGAVSDGVLISGNVVGAPGPDTILEVSGNTITGYNNGVHLFGNVSEAVVQVNGNDEIDAGNHGVFFEGDVLSNSLVTVNGNEDITSTFGDGVHFSGSIGGGSFIHVSDNNDGIVAANHGIYFGGPVNGATFNIHDNIIRANQDGGFVGSGIYFANTINNATINIGDGERDSNPSNFIVVGPQGDGDTDGIHFAGIVGQGAKIKIDGNRIGYNGDGSVNAINGDGIEFASAVNGNADIDVIDNRVRAIGNTSGTGDGVKFSGHVGGTANVAVGVLPTDGNNIDVTGNGVEFNGVTGGTVSVASNTIVADENGVEFGAGSPSIEGGADVFVLNNTINATLDGVHVEDDITGAGTTFTAKRNTITAGDDGFDIDNVRSAAVVHIGGAANGGGGPLNNEGNRITADGNGIEFDAGVDATVLVQKNRISAGDDGINVRDEDAGHVTAIDGGALVNILDNDIGFQGSDTIGGHGINIEEDVTGDSTVNIARNNIGRLGTPVGLDGIHFGGAINGLSNVNIFANNHGIHAQDHGIYFGGPINGGATVDIDDNIISANEDNAIVGSGIFFNGVITNATINIGDGTGGSEHSGGSNIILVADNTTIGGGDINNLDGIHFNKNVGQGAVVNIDGNRIGYGGNSFNGPYSANDVADDGIEFRGTADGNADINVTDNWILASDDGIIFDSLVTGNANILIGGFEDDNHIFADDDGIQFGDDLTGQALVEISYNDIKAESDGIVFDGEVNNALNPATSEQELLITRNDIWGGDNGIHFNGAISNARHDTVISFNTIEGEDEQGVVFDERIDDAHIRINNNHRIEGQVDGVRFLGEVDEAQIDINDNIRIQGNDEEAIHFFREIDESTINIIGNDNLVGGDNGIEFAGIIDESNITISGNNDGIHADNHGILFGAAIEDDSVVNIHDNIISANEDGGSTGDGIHFAGTITDSDIFIGDGFGSSLNNNPSNVISGVDGIHFAANIGENADIVIDGNRIGYNEPRLNPSTGAGSRVTDDGISFAFLSHNAEITITDNWIRSADDGIIFNNNVDDDVQVLIGGDNEAPDGNHIDAEGDGIHFAGDITEDSLIEVSFNTIDADENGIQFDGTTSNDDDTFPFRDDEILIAHNSIEADENGIAFFGRAEDERHDIMIRDNTKIHGHGGHGIVHTGGIDDAELWILNNDDIFGETDGIHITGPFTNDARILIDGNTNIDTDNGDGIEVTQSGGGGGVDVDITDNQIHFVGDNGIEVDNVDNVWIASNRIRNTGRDGINVDDSDNAHIHWNRIRLTGDDGIYVEDSDNVHIDGNRIRRTGDDGIDVRRSGGANIENNRIRRTQGDGIQVRGSSFVQIDDNRIRYAGDDGIDFEDGFFSAITDNNIRFANHNGIEVNDSAFILIDENEVADADEAGIFIDPSAIIFVTNNLLTSNDIGLHVQGPDNGYINVTGNTFTNNRVGLRAESGIIDLTGISSDPSFGGFGNKFIGGQHGMEFDAWGGRPEQLSLVRTGGIFAGGYTYDGQINDTWPTVLTNPVNFGGTIGSQYFEGQSVSFVTLRRDTFTAFRGTEAIWLDATDSTYFRPGFGAFSPADTGDILTQDQLDFLESMFRHRPDATRRGIFFFGALPAPEGVEFLKDPIYDPFDGGVSGLNVTITGLPRVSGFAPASTGAAGLNAIAPAAGDETTSADLANIEPAAGGEGGQNVSCWSDAVNAAGTGGPVNYSYGGTFEESIAAAATCGAQSF